MEINKFLCIYMRIKVYLSAGYKDPKSILSHKKASDKVNICQGNMRLEAGEAVNQ